MYTDQDISNLVARVQQLEQQAAVSRQGLFPALGILSRNLLTRAFSVWGLFTLAQLLIGIVFTCVIVLLGLLLGINFGNWINQISSNIPIV